jgi:hypothetical protein
VLKFKNLPIEKHFITKIQQKRNLNIVGMYLFCGARAGNNPNHIGGVGAVTKGEAVMQETRFVKVVLLYTVEEKEPKPYQSLTRSRSRIRMKRLSELQ